MTASPRKAIRRMSEKKRTSLKGQPIFSTISKRSESPRKRPRKKSERERIYGPPGYVEWCKSQVCVACRRSSRCDVAHILSGGVGRKDDWIRTVPLCSDKPYRLGCHSLLHTWGRRSFEVQWGIDLEKCAAETERAWVTYKTTNNPTPK